MLMGYGGLNLPYDVPANEFLTIEGKKLSTSRNWAVWLPDYLERYSPDPLRYFLSANMPETSDADFSWREFVRRNNDELVATYGNLVHRVLTFTFRHFDSRVPTPQELDASSLALLEKAKIAFGAVDSLLYNCHFRDATKAAMSLAQETNRYLDEKSPWKTLKTDRQPCATALFVSLSSIATLKTLFYPFLPFSSEKLQRLLGFTGAVKDEGWGFHQLPAGQNAAREGRDPVAEAQPSARSARSRGARFIASRDRTVFDTIYTVTYVHSRAMARKKISTTVYITPEQNERLKLLHDRTKVPVAEYIRQGMDLVLGKYRGQRPGQATFDEL